MSVVVTATSASTGTVLAHRAARLHAVGIGTAAEVHLAEEVGEAVVENVDGIEVGFVIGSHNHEVSP